MEFGIRKWIVLHVGLATEGSYRRLSGWLGKSSLYFVGRVDSGDAVVFAFLVPYW